MTDRRSAVPGVVAAVWLAGAGLLVGCGGGDADGVRFSVRDSAGVRIVENPPIAQASECRLSEEPRLDIGAADGRSEFEFYRVSDATLLPDGRIAVVNSGSREIRVYDGDGSFIRSFGAEGEGPGEFRVPARLWQREDSLVVYDVDLQRFTWFSVTGSLLRQVSLRPPEPGTNRAFLLANGRILASVVDFRPASTGFRPQPLHLVLHDPGGQAADTVGEYVWRRLGEVGPEGASFVTGPVFEPRTYVAAADSRIVVGTGVDREVEILRLDGRLLRIVRWSGGDRSVSDENIEVFRARELDEANSGSDSAAIRQRLEERPVAEHFPSLDRIRVGRDGRLWIRRYRRPGREQAGRWLVFDEQGELACRTELPRRFTLLEAGSEYVLGTWRDELDVIHVRLRGLERPDAGG